MKVVVKQVFADRSNFTKRYAVGDTLELDDNRAKDLINRKMVEEVKPKATKE